MNRLSMLFSSPAARGEAMSCPSNQRAPHDMTPEQQQAYERARQEILRAAAASLRASVTAGTWMALAGRDLVAVPPEISQLVVLTQLYLQNNQLKALPPEIGQLKALKILDLSSNPLRSLPPEIGQLKVLTRLDLAID